MKNLSRKNYLLGTLFFSFIFLTSLFGNTVQLKSYISENEYEQMKVVYDINQILIEGLNDILNNKKYVKKMDREKLFTKSNNKKKIVNFSSQLRKIYLLSRIEHSIEQNYLNNIDLENKKLLDKKVAASSDVKEAYEYLRKIKNLLKQSPRKLENFSGVLEAVLNLEKLKLLKINSLHNQFLYNQTYMSSNCKCLQSKSLKNCLIKETKNLFRMYKVFIKFLDEWGGLASFEIHSFKKEYKFIKKYRYQTENLLWLKNDE